MLKKNWADIITQKNFFKSLLLHLSALVKIQLLTHIKNVYLYLFIANGKETVIRALSIKPFKNEKSIQLFLLFVKT